MNKLEITPEPYHRHITSIHPMPAPRSRHWVKLECGHVVVVSGKPAQRAQQHAALRQVPQPENRLAQPRSAGRKERWRHESLGKKKTTHLAPAAAVDRDVLRHVRGAVRGSYCAEA